MKTMHTYFGVLIAIILVFNACKNSTEPDKTDEIKIADNTVVINDDVENEPSKINENSIEFEYDQTAPDISVGEIIVGYNDTTAYLRKVTDISFSQGTMTVETVQATLDEVIEKGSFEWSGLLEFDLAGSYKRGEVGYVHPAVQIDQVKKNAATSGINFSFNGTGINFGTDMDLEILSGSFGFTPSFDIDAEYYWGLQEVHAIVGGDLDFDILAEVTLSATGGASGEIPLLSDVPAGSPIYIQAGYLPIWIYPEFDLFLGVAVTSTGSVTLTGGINTDNTIKAGFQWTDDNGFETIYEKDLDGNIYPVEISATTEQTTRVYLKPRLSFMIYSAVGPHIALEPYIGVSGIESYNEYCTEWLLGITGEVGANIDILGYSVSAGLDLPDYNTTIDEECEEVQENNPPVVTSLTANPPTVNPGGTSTITCDASDSDGDNLSYSWSATGGSISGSGSAVTYYAPASDGTYTITCTVNDGNGGEDSETVNVTITTANTLPEITSLTANPPTVNPGGTSTITCDASDSDGDNLSYSWSATGGSISGNSYTVTYYAPASDGTYTITCTVNDGNGGEDSGTVNVTVSSGGTGTVTDIDGNVYQTIIIGTQEWMMENLKVTRYRNGDPIPTGYSNSEWGDLDDTETGAYCVYDDQESNAYTYGYLYNWYAVDDTRNIAPVGWHIPEGDEWQILVDYLGGYSVAGGKMKETGTEHWNSPNTGATNESGFTALPGGYRSYDDGNYAHMGITGYFWPSTEYTTSAWHRWLHYGGSVVTRSLYPKRGGFSVRCIRD